MRLPAKDNARHIQTPTRSAHHNYIPRFDFTCTPRVINYHRDTGRTGIAPFLHNRMRATHWHLNLSHHLFNGAEIDLRKEEKVYIIKMECSFLENLADNLLPAFDIDLRWI